MLLINHHHLYYFWVVAKEGSIVKACQTLHLAQPTISAQLIKLEKELGKTLFIRQRKGVELTEDGRLVRDYADLIFNYSQEMVDALKDRPGGRRIQVQIGVVDQVSKELSERLMTRALRDEAQAMITAVEGTLPSLLSELDAHNLDLVLSNAPLPIEETSGYWTSEVGVFPVDFMASPVLARKVKRFPEDLAKIPLLLPTRASPVWSHVEHYLTQHRVEPRIAAEVQDAALLRRLALRGLGAAPLVRYGEENKQLVTLHARPTGIVERVWLFAKKRYRLNPIAEQLLRQFRGRMAL